jgi:hypothetical protein
MKRQATDTEASRYYSRRNESGDDLTPGDEESDSDAEPEDESEPDEAEGGQKAPNSFTIAKFSKGGEGRPLIKTTYKYELIECLAKASFERVILDEGHACRRPYNQYSQFVRLLNLQSIVMSTATPLLNRVEDVRGYLFLIAKAGGFLDEDVSSLTSSGSRLRRAHEASVQPNNAVGPAEERR